MSTGFRPADALLYRFNAGDAFRHETVAIFNGLGSTIQSGHGCKRPIPLYRPFFQGSRAVDSCHGRLRRAPSPRTKGSERPLCRGYAYCLTEQQTLNGTRARRPFLLEGIQGVNGAPVLSYPSGEFAVIVSEYDRKQRKRKAGGEDRFGTRARG